MSIDGSDAHPIYRPDIQHTLDADARAALDRDSRDWSGAGHLPDAWVAALAGLTSHAACGIDIDGVWVAFTVAHTTNDPKDMCSALRKLRRIVADTPAASPDVPVIERRLPAQIASARWNTGAGEVTVVHPERRRHRKPRRRFFTAGASSAVLWTLTHGKAIGPATAAVAVAAVAGVTVAVTPATTPAPPPVAGPTRDQFVPARSSLQPETHPQPAATPRRSRMAGPATTGPDPAAPPSRDPSPPPATSVAPTVAVTVTVPTHTPPPPNNVTSKDTSPRNARKRHSCATVHLLLAHINPCKH